MGNTVEAREDRAVEQLSKHATDGHHTGRDLAIEIQNDLLRMDRQGRRELYERLEQREGKGQGLPNVHVDHGHITVDDDRSGRSIDIDSVTGRAKSHRRDQAGSEENRERPDTGGDGTFTRTRGNRTTTVVRNGGHTETTITERVGDGEREVFHRSEERDAEGRVTEYHQTRTNKDGTTTTTDFDGTTTHSERFDAKTGDLTVRDRKPDGSYTYKKTDGKTGDTTEIDYDAKTGKSDMYVMDSEDYLKREYHMDKFGNVQRVDYNEDGTATVFDSKTGKTYTISKDELDAADRERDRDDDTVDAAQRKFIEDYKSTHGGLHPSPFEMYQYLAERNGSKNGGAGEPDKEPPKEPYTYRDSDNHVVTVTPKADGTENTTTRDEEDRKIYTRDEDPRNGSVTEEWTEYDARGKATTTTRITDSRGNYKEYVNRRLTRTGSDTVADERDET
jgi:hypothetical protein